MRLESIETRIGRAVARRPCLRPSSGGPAVSHTFTIITAMAPNHATATTCTSHSIIGASSRRAAADRSLDGACESGHMAGPRLPTAAGCSTPMTDTLVVEARPSRRSGIAGPAPA
jgi:hypothetical protein